MNANRQLILPYLNAKVTALGIAIHDLSFYQIKLCLPQNTHYKHVPMQWKLLLTLRQINIGCLYTAFTELRERKKIEDTDINKIYKQINKASLYSIINGCNGPVYCRGKHLPFCT